MNEPTHTFEIYREPDTGGEITIYVDAILHRGHRATWLNPPESAYTEVVYARLEDGTPVDLTRDETERVEEMGYEAMREQANDSGSMFRLEDW